MHVNLSDDELKNLMTWEQKKFKLLKKNLHLCVLSTRQTLFPQFSFWFWNYSLKKKRVPRNTRLWHRTVIPFLLLFPSNSIWECVLDSSPKLLFQTNFDSLSNFGNVWIECKRILSSSSSAAIWKNHKEFLKHTLSKYCHPVSVHNCLESTKQPPWR